MKEKTFYRIIGIICLIGIVLTGMHLKYIFSISNGMSITAFISNEV